MVRFVRLAASVVMVTSGLWLVGVFLNGPSERAEMPRQAQEKSETVAATSRLPRLIPDPQGPSDAERQRQAAGEEAARVADLAPLAPLLADASPPAEPLPSVPSEIRQQAPPLEASYRSALDLPPPPLLDAHAPPPLAGGSTWRYPQQPTTLVSHQPPPAFGGFAGGDAAETAAPSPQPAFYIVQDGDDLTSIATRFYGHPAAARYVFEANRERLPAADVLPIGATLVLPPKPGAEGRVQRPGGWIEPGP